MLLKKNSFTINPSWSYVFESCKMDLFSLFNQVTKSRGSNPSTVTAGSSNKNAANFKNDVEVFSGFKPAIEACYMHWDDYTIPGITYSQGSRLYHCPFTCFRHADLNQINSSSSVLNCEHPPLHHNPHHHAMAAKNRARSVDVSSVLYRSSADGPFDISRAPFPISVVGLPAQDTGGNRSSVSSEGFCENDADILGASIVNDTDEGSESSSSGTGEQIRGRPSVATHRASDWSDSDSQTEQVKQQASTSTSLPNFEPAIKPTATTSVAVAVSIPPMIPVTVPTVIAPSEEKSAPSTGDMPTAASTPACVAPPAIADKWDSSNSDSQQSGDEYNVYYYDPKALINASNGNFSSAADKKDEPSIIANVRKMEEPWEILFARAEALHAHGHSREACYLGVKLAHELLANPPQLMVDLPPMPCKGKRRKVK